MSSLMYYRRAMARAQWSTLTMVGTWGFGLWLVTYKGREGWRSRSHDAYMSQDESTVKRRGQPVQSHLEQGVAMQAVHNDHTGYQAMVGALHGNDMPARPRAAI